MFFDLIHRHRWAVVIISIATIIGLGAGTTRLTVSTDNRIFYGPENPYYQEYVAFEAEFTDNDNILFVVSGEHSVVENRFPQAIRWLTDNVGGLKYVSRVDSLANYPRPTTQDDTLVVQSILDWACPEGETCRSNAKDALTKSHLVNRLISPSHSATGILASVSIERGAVGKIEALHESTIELQEEFRARFPEFEIYSTGGVPMMAAFASETSSDLALLLPAALLAIFILLTFVLGSFRLALVIFIVGVAAIVATLGIAGWTGHVINNATSIVPLIVFTLVVTSSMHVAVHYSRNTEPDTDSNQAITQAKASLSSSLTPILLSAATSAVSLCSLWFVDSPPIRQLGLMSAFGVAVGCLFTLTLLPLLLVAVRHTSDTHLSRWIQSWLNVYAKGLEAGKDQIILATLVFSVSIAGLLHLTVNEDFVRFFDESVPFRIQTDRATELLAGPNHIEIVLENPHGSVFDPQFLNYVNEMSELLREKKLVANVHSFSDVMSEVSMAFSDKPLSEIETGDELAQLFLVYELSLQQGQSNTDLINATQDKARISALLGDSTSNEIQALERNIYEHHREASSEYKLLVTGENIPVAHLSWINIRSMVTGIFLSLSFTALALGIAFKGIKLGTTALIATLAPVLAGFGIWGWINGDIGLAATAIIALTIGVVVDDTAHYIYRFLDARHRLELDAWAAAGYACHRAGGAIVATSIVMGLGLSLLLLSSFKVNSSFGAVACLIIFAALAFNLTILPRLTVWAFPSSSTDEEKST